jgi:NAD(P)H-flavin reductase
MPELKLMSNEPEGTMIRRLVFNEAPEGYERPGQFVTATVGELKAGFFAIASSPGEPLTLLIKQSGETAEALTALEPGAMVSVSATMGKGFVLDGAAGRDLVILVNGTGISAVRGVIEAEIAAGLPRKVDFFYGVISPAHRSFVADLARWEAAGVGVHTCVSHPEGTGWDGPTAYVQHHAKELGLVREDVSVLLVGVRPMCDEAKELFATAGCPSDQVLLNF